MSSLPAASYLNDAARTEGEMKTAFEDQLAGVKQIPGSGIAETTLTISGGSVTPSGGGPGIFSIDTEAAAANDDLTNIVQTNLPDGSLLIVRPANAARTVTVKHNAGGAGQISLRTSGDFTLGNTTHWLLLKRTGTTWVEIGRWPREGVTAIDTKTANYTVTEADRGKIIDGTSGTWTLSLLAAARAGIGFDLTVRNSGTGIVTIDGNASETVDGGTTLKLLPGHEILIVCDGSNWKSAGRYANTVHRGHLFGLTLSNNATDATNDIDIAAGECASSDASAADRVLLSISALTKRLDATWAAGTNQGGRASSQALANGTWHMFAMRVAGADDIGFDTSVTGANLVTDHSATHVRRIGSILRESAAVVAFTQDGDLFLRSTSVLDVAATNPGTSAVSRTLSVPTGLSVIAIMNVGLVRTSNDTVAYISPLSITDASPATNANPLATVSASLVGLGGTISGLAGAVPVRTNTSAQVRSRLSASGASETLYIATLAWMDSRGRQN